MCRAEIHCLIDQDKISSGPIRPQNISLERRSVLLNQFSPGGKTLGCIDTHVHTKIVAMQLQTISRRLLVSGQLHCSISLSVARRPIGWSTFKGTACIPPFRNGKETMMKSTRSMKNVSVRVRVWRSLVPTHLDAVRLSWHSWAPQITNFLQEGSASCWGSCHRNGATAARIAMNSFETPIQTRPALNLPFKLFFCYIYNPQSPLCWHCLLAERAFNQLKIAGIEKAISLLLHSSCFLDAPDPDDMAASLKQSSQKIRVQAVPYMKRLEAWLWS